MSYENLLEFVSGLDIVDTHEHLPAFEKERLTDSTDVLAEYLKHYISSDLVSAGLSDEGLAFARDASKDLAKRWETVAPFWDASRNTGYARALDLSVRLIYGIERIDGKTLGRLNEAFLDAIRRGGHYDRVLRKISRIRVSIEDDRTPVVTGPQDYADMTYFRPVVCTDNFVGPANAAAIETLSRWTDVDIHSLEDLERACETHIERHLAAGAIGLKCAVAYNRPLRFEKADARDAEADLAKILKGARNPETPLAVRPFRNLEDHMMRFVCALADRRGLFMQVHTGIQEGNGNLVVNSEPSQLANLFLEYPNARFDLFHIGYPYQQTVSALAKNFRNVSIDFAWAHIVSPEAAIRALIEYLDCVPANKISGFGGDFLYIDGVAGHAHIARENIAKALAFKVKHGAFDIARAKELARMILVDNPTRIFNLVI